MNFFKNEYTKALERKRDALLDKISVCERYTPAYNVGLNDEQVKERVEKELTNKRKKVVTKSYFKIVFDNFFTFYSVLLYILGILVAVAGYIQQLMFLGVILCNAIIGFIQDIRARMLVDKLSIVNKNKIIAIRNGQEVEVEFNDLVLDDILLLKNGDQIPADCVVIKGKIFVNEAMLTGEPDAIRKKVNDIVYSGTYVSSGTCYARVDKIGITNKSDIIQEKAKAFNKPKSEILKSLNFLFKIIAVFVISFAILTLVSFVFVPHEISNGDFYVPADNFWQWFINKDSQPITSFVGSMVSMIPAGLFLLTSVALSAGVLTLARKRCLVQELYCIEMLARVDTLCLDKTGTITDGTMSLSDIVKIERSYNNDKIKTIISSILFATKDDNYTAKALKEKCGTSEVYKATKALPFSSESKYSAVCLDKLGTFGLGAYGYIKINNKKETEEIVKKYSSKGYRCLLLTISQSKIEKEKLPADNECIAVLLLEDHIRDDAPETLAWFSSNGVDIKVISGDDPLTVSEIAKKAGIPNYDKYINLNGLSIEQVKQAATKYTIFGRVSPEQKEALVVALKNAKKTVAMTGDGVNDILALKRADCSIAMASGSDAAKNISHLVLLDSNFSVLPSVVAEGRRVINNLQRTSSLFLAKTMFSMIVTLVSIIAVFASRDINMQFPLSVNNFYIWEIAFIGVGGFFLALEPNASKLRGSFLSNAIRKALPASITISVIILVFYTLYMTNYYNHNLYLLGDPYWIGEYFRPDISGPVGAVINDETGLVITSEMYEAYNTAIRNSFRAMSAVAMVFIGFVSFIRVCWPLSKYRFYIVILIVCMLILGLVGFYLIPMDGGNGLNSFGGVWFQFEFTWLSMTDWLYLLLFGFSGICMYVVLDRLINRNAYIENIEVSYDKLNKQNKIGQGSVSNEK